MIGNTINGYKIIRHIGSGGMSDVWYAENTLGNCAAIKILKKKYRDDKVLSQRFVNEAKLLVKVKHNHLREVYDIGEIDSDPCIIMEYLDGADLSLRVKNGERFSQEQLITWWNYMVDVLQFFHGKGIIHRDIKPSNIFITNDSNLKLVDFGIAKQDEHGDLTLTGQSMGTIVYMSPEQVKGTAISTKTDLYSLAVTFYHLATGKDPYDKTTGSQFDIQLKIVQEPLNLSGLSSFWVEVLEGYLVKDPQQRKALSMITTDATVVGKKVSDPKPVSNHQSLPDETTVIETRPLPERKEPVITETKSSNKKNLFAVGAVLIALIVVFGIIVAIEANKNNNYSTVDYGSDSTKVADSLQAAWLADSTKAAYDTIKPKM